jgi:hypothetical protein
VVEFALKSLQKKGTESTVSVIGFAFMNAMDASMGQKSSKG